MNGSVMLPQGLPATDVVVQRDGAWQVVFDPHAGMPAGAQFTRASAGTAWTGSNLVTCGTDLPRLEVDPATQAVRGLLMEAAGTNFARSTHDLGNGWWSKVGATCTTSGIKASDGSWMQRVAEGAVAGEHGFFRDMAVAAGRYFAVSLDVKAGERTKFVMALRATDGTSGSTVVFDTVSGVASAPVVTGTGFVLERGMQPLGGGIYRCHVIGRAGATQTSVRVMFGLHDGTSGSYTGVSGQGLFVALPQIEIGTSSALRMVSSFIPNPGTTQDVSRSGDVLRWQDLPGLGLDNERGTFVMDFMLRSMDYHGQYQRLMEMNLNMENRLILAYNPLVASKIRYSVVYENVQTTVLSPGSNAIAPLTMYRLALRYGKKSMGLSFMGEGEISANLGGFPACKELRLGQSAYGSYALGGWLRRVVYYPTDTLNLQAMSQL